MITGLRVWMFRALQVGCAGLGGATLVTAVMEAGEVSCCLTIWRVIGVLALMIPIGPLDERCMWASGE
jgi:hypothetical protein